MVVKALLIMFIFAFSVVLHANECSAWDGKVIQPIDSAGLALQIVKIPRYKNEYETTAAFNARVDKALVKIKKQYIANVIPDMDYVFYDADNRKMVVSGSVLDREVSFSGFDNPDYVLNMGAPFYIYGMYYERKIGSYIGVNSFGIKKKVDQYDGSGVVIFDKISKYDSIPINSFAIENLSPAQAKSLKNNFRVSIVLSPKKPYFAFISRHYDATMDDPEELTINYVVVFADMACALFHDSTGKVYKGVEINKPISYNEPDEKIIPNVRIPLEPFEQTLDNGKCRKVKIELTLRPLKSNASFEMYLPEIRGKFMDILKAYQDNWLNDSVKKQISSIAGEVIKDAEIVDVYMRGGFCDSQLRY